MNENVDGMMIRLVGLALAVLLMAGMTIYTGLFKKTSGMDARATVISVQDGHVAAEEFSGTPEINFSSNTTQRPGAVCSALCSFKRLSLLLLQAGHEVVGLDGLRGEAVVVPPAGEGGGNGQAAGNELFQLGALDGQHGLAHGAEHLIGQGQRQRSGAGQGGCGNLVMGHSQYLSFCFKICVRCGSGLLQHDGAGEDEGGVVAIIGAAVGDVDAVVCCDPGGLDRGG